VAGYAAVYAIALNFAATIVTRPPVATPVRCRGARHTGQIRDKMQDRFTRLSLGALVFLVAAFVAQPYIDRMFFSGTPRPIEPRADLTEVERAAIEIFGRVSPSVVHIVARGRARGAPRLDEEGVQSGTGFIWDTSRHVVTNSHVVAGTSQVAVRIASGDMVQARAVGVAESYDLAVLQLAAARPLPAALAIGTSADLQVGQLAFAIGNPFGLDHSLTTGAISALKRRLPTSAGREIGNVIQTDAAINPGNSGGPLLDSAGRLIGVNTAIYSPSGGSAGIGFAIPVDVVNRIVPELIRNGRVPTPGIGIVAANEAIAARLGADGVVVVRTVPGSPAERAGLRGLDAKSGSLGDVIVAVDGHPVRNLTELTDQLEQIGVGKTVELSIKRDAGTKSVQIQVADISRQSS
jgi:S1-C subfamily serine protease